MAGGSATVSIFPNVSVDVSVTTNAPRTQRATIIIDGNTSGPFTGSGERNLIGSDSTDSGSGLVRVILEYDSGDGSWVGSQTNTGGPYVIGSSGFAIVVGENGDDSDFNDIVVQFSWKSR